MTTETADPGEPWAIDLNDPRGDADVISASEDCSSFNFGFLTIVLP